MQIRFAFPEIINPLLKLEEIQHGVSSKLMALDPQDRLLLEDYLWVLHNVERIGFQKTILLGDAYHFNNLIAQRPAMEGVWTQMIEVLKTAMSHRESESIFMVDNQFKELTPMVNQQLYDYLSGRVKKIFSASADPFEENIEIVLLYLGGLIATMAVSTGLETTIPSEIVKHFETNQFANELERHIYFLSLHYCSLAPEDLTQVTGLNQVYRINTGYTYPELETPIIANITLEGNLVNGTWYCKVLDVESDIDDTGQAVEEAKKIFEGDLASKSDQAGTTHQPIIWLSKTI